MTQYLCIRFACMPVRTKTSMGRGLIVLHGPWLTEWFKTDFNETWCERHAPRASEFGGNWSHLKKHEDVQSKGPSFDTKHARYLKNSEIRAASVTGSATCKFCAPLTTVAPVATQFLPYLVLPSGNAFATFPQQVPRAKLLAGMPNSRPRPPLSSSS